MPPDYYGGVTALLSDPTLIPRNHHDSSVLTT